MIFRRLFSATSPARTWTRWGQICRHIQGKRTEDRRRKTGLIRSQRTEDRKQRTEESGQRAESRRLIRLRPTPARLGKTITGRMSRAKRRAGKQRQRDSIANGAKPEACRKLAGGRPSIL